MSRPFANIPVLTHALFGNLTISAFPHHDFVAAAAAALVVAGAIATVAVITRLRAWRYLWDGWLTSLDHKKIGVMYIVLGFIMLSRALIEAVLMRTQQTLAVNAPGVVSPEHFAQLFSTHGTIMIFFVAMPLLTGMINFVMPLQIGARDVAFPLLNSTSLWLTAAGAALMMASLVLGQFSTGGWTAYPPFTEVAFSPGVGPDYWIWAVSLASFGSTLTGINFAVTIYKLRAAGMNLMRMPLFCWTALCTSILMIFAMPPLSLATAMLALDRYLGWHFFTADAGGNLMNYANLFWLFGHPEVYILILPAFGVFSEVISTFSAKTLYGYWSLVAATMGIAVLSFTVWVHHFFTMGQDADLNAAFGIATMLIAIPTGVKVYNWIWTMFRGRIRFTVPMLYSLAFLLTFVIGGVTGIVLATPPLDYMVHNSVYLVAHFHNMLIPGLLYGMIAGYQFWFPKAFGFRLHEGWGRVSVGCWVVGFYLAFMPLYGLGILGMPRRSALLFEDAYRPWLDVALAGAGLLAGGWVSLIVQLVVSVRRRVELAVPLGDPWDGHAIEWSVPCPAPEYNFAVLPVVAGRENWTRAKADGSAWAAPADYAPIELPCNSATGVVIGVAAGLCGFALVWAIWWLAIAGLLVVIGAVIARGFVDGAVRVIPPEQVAAEHRAFLALVARSKPSTRDEELLPTNRGLPVPQA